MSYKSPTVVDRTEACDNETLEFDFEKITPYNNDLKKRYEQTSWMLPKSYVNKGNHPDEIYWKKGHYLMFRRNKQEYYLILKFSDIKTIGNFLDNMLQVTNKGWCDIYVTGLVWQIVQHICRYEYDNGIQGVFCPFGQSVVDVEHKPKNNRNKL